MTKRMLSVRLSEPGWERLEKLVEVYGSKTMVVEMAIERMLRLEEAKAHPLTPGREALLQALIRSNI